MHGWKFIRRKTDEWSFLLLKEGRSKGPRERKGAGGKDGRFYKSIEVRMQVERKL